MKNFKLRIQQLVADQSGATAVEYGLIVAMIAVGALGAFQLAGASISNTFMTIVDAVTPD